MATIRCNGTLRLCIFWSKLTKHNYRMNNREGFIRYKYTAQIMMFGYCTTSFSIVEWIMSIINCKVLLVIRSYVSSMPCPKCPLNSILASPLLSCLCCVSKSCYLASNFQGAWARMMSLQNKNRNVPSPSMAYVKSKIELHVPKWQ